VAQPVAVAAVRFTSAAVDALPPGAYAGSIYNVDVVIGRRRLASLVPRPRGGWLARQAR
jgi:hypothetical protein